MFTWSFGCAPSPASAAITSFAFMFDEVPEPVWKTSIGNWPSWRPCAISSAAAPIRCASVGVEQPELGVRARRRALDPAEPAHDRDRHPLPGHREVRDRLAGLPAPQLLRRLNAHLGTLFRLSEAHNASAHSAAAEKDTGPDSHA